MDVLEQGEPASERTWRRNQLILAVVVALLLGGGTTVLLRGQSGPARAPAAAPSTEAPAVLDPPPSPTPQNSPSPSTSPSPSRRTVPASHRPSPPPPPAPSSPPPPPVMYAVTKPMCNYINFTPINALSKPAGKPDVTSDIKHFGNADHVFYYCNGVTGQVVLTYIGPTVYPTIAEANAAYFAEKQFVPPNAETIPDLGDDNWANAFDAGTFRVYVLAGNMILQVNLKDSSSGGPPADKLRPVALSTARDLLPKLRKP
jgi:hypothetical protein